jgi:hypothetical protein
MKFITDMGFTPVLTNVETGEESRLGRYGVWSDEDYHKPEVIAVGDDLDELQLEHGPDLPLYKIEAGALVPMSA